jgi:hypothetical protein
MTRLTARSRWLALLCALPLAAGCSDDEEEEFSPASYIDKLRILAVKATPPDAIPGEQVRLESLVVDPLSGARPLSFVWLICDPDPTGLGSNVCASQDTTRGLEGVLGEDGALPEGVTVRPFGDGAWYQTPRDVFDDVPPDDPLRQYGTQATVLLVAYNGRFPQELQSPDVNKELALKRLRVVARGAKRNKNPVVASVTVNGQPLTDSESPVLEPGSVVKLAAKAKDGSAEDYERPLPDGTTLSVTEKLVFSWFTNSGRLDGLTRQAARTPDGGEIDFVVPTYDQSVGGYADLYVVLRDPRGGLDWVRRRVRVREP